MQIFDMWKILFCFEVIVDADTIRNGNSGSF